MLDFLGTRECQPKKYSPSKTPVDIFGAKQYFLSFGAPFLAVRRGDDAALRSSVGLSMRACDEINDKVFGWVPDLALGVFFPFLQVWV
jgi:hypothetical protein